jgi:glycosyltransferase involved in cell wall biosynthesis
VTEAIRVRVAVLIPALNEAETLPQVLDELRDVSVPLDRVGVVDNGSTDGTGRVARARGAEVVREDERGYGAACLRGLFHLTTAGETPHVVVFLDGDQSDDPSALPRLLRPIRDGTADFVVGVRAAAPGRYASSVPLHARLGNGLIRWGARLLHGARFRDLGPFRAIRLPALDALEMDDRNWGWTLQMQIRAHHLGIPTEEVEVPHRPRGGGRSKVSGTLTGSARAGLKMLRTLVSERLRPAGRTY